MPRFARKKSSTGIYHIMLRAVNRQKIFHDREDAQRFIDTLARFEKQSGYKLYGYCLMPNHIHLLLQEGEEDLAQALKRIGVSFVNWYNNKYERVGHLFQDRFKSETVEDEPYLLVVLRYIHQNPQKAGLVSDIADYEWSSYKDYLKGSKSLIEQEFILNIFSQNSEKAISLFASFMRQANEDHCLEDEGKVKKNWTAEELAELLYQLAGFSEFSKLQSLEKSKRDELLLKLREAGLTIRKIEELTGLGRGMIERVTRGRNINLQLQ